MSLRVYARAEVHPGKWDAYVEQHPLGWWWHTSGWIDYSLSYSPGARDLSFAVADPVACGGLQGVVPLLERDGVLVMGGQVTPAPLVAPRDEPAAQLALAAARERFGGEPLPIQMRPGMLPTSMPPLGWRIEQQDTYVVDLRLQEAERWAMLRRSYRSLIHKAERVFEVSVLQEPSIVAHLQAVHLEVAGHKTRSDETWKRMGDWMAGGHALAAVATSPDGRVAGFAYAIRYRQWAYYASGATREDSVQHALQWHLMRALAADGQTMFYELGHAAGPEATDKERAVAFFKSGFGGGRLPFAVAHPEVRRGRLTREM